MPDGLVRGFSQEAAKPLHALAADDPVRIDPFLEVGDIFATWPPTTITASGWY